MKSFWEFAKIALIVGGAFALIVLILLILPGSPFERLSLLSFLQLRGY